MSILDDDYWPDPDLTTEKVRARLRRLQAQQQAIDNIRTTPAQQTAAKNN